MNSLNSPSFGAHGDYMKEAKGPAVWDRKEMENDPSWSFEMPPQARAELHHCLKQFDADMVELDSLTMNDFPMPSLDAISSDMRDQLSCGRGLVKISGFEVSNYSLAETKLAFIGLSLHLGIPVSQSYRGDYVGEVIDRKDPDDSRRYHNGGEFIMHRDPTSDVVGLLAIRRGKTGGESRLISSGMVHNVLLQEHPELMQTIYDGFPYMRTTPDRGKSKLYTQHRIPAFKFHPSGEMLAHYIPGFSEFYQERDGLAADHIEVVAQTAIKEVLWNRPELYLETMMQPGDMQFVNNRLLMHARADYEDWDEPEKYRLLLRVWLMLAGQSKVPDEMQHFEYRDRADGGIAKIPEVS